MKKSPGEAALSNNLKPSKFSADGFMGQDTRTIDELISTDDKKMNKMGISAAALVDALKSAHQKAKEAFGAEIEIHEGVFASHFEARGKIPSPFSGDGVFEKGETIVLEKKTGKQMIITELGIALIEKHRFFQGLGSRYRIDPGVAVRLLNITSP